MSFEEDSLDALTRYSLFRRTKRICNILNSKSQPSASLQGTSKWSNLTAEYLKSGDCLTKTFWLCNEKSSFLTAMPVNEDDEYAALTWFTKTIGQVPADHPWLFEGYGRRSAVLYTLGMYEQSLLDVNRAMNLGTPRESYQVEGLNIRKERCLARIRELQTENYRVEENATNPIRQINSFEDDEWQAICNIPDLNDPNLGRTSSKVRLADGGKCMEASDHIQPGEILSVEKRFVSIIHSESELKNCFHCLAECYALIPCPSCTWMFYCSDSCRQEAESLYHLPYECRIDFTGPSDTPDPDIIEKLDSMLSWEDIRLLAIRSLLIGTANGAPGNPSLLGTLMTRFPSIHHILADRIVRDRADPATDYERVLQMRRIFYTSDRLHMKLLWYALDLTIQLRKLGYFRNGQCDSYRLNENLSSLEGEISHAEFFVALLLYNHMHTFRNKHFRIFQMDDRRSQKYHYIATEDIGVCVTPLQSIVNHSCYPNAYYFTRGQDLILVATRPLRPGDQVFVNYCETFYSSSIDQRAKFAEAMFNSKCNCRACQEKWPDIFDLVGMSWKYSVKQDNAIQDDQLIAELKFKANDVKDKVKDGASNLEIRGMLIELINSFHDNFEEPLASATYCEEFLYHFMLLVYNNIRKEYISCARRDWRAYLFNVVDFTKDMIVDTYYQQGMAVATSAIEEIEEIVKALTNELRVKEEQKAAASGTRAMRILERIVAGKVRAIEEATAAANEAAEAAAAAEEIILRGNSDTFAFDLEISKAVAAVDAAIEAKMKSHHY